MNNNISNRITDLVVRYLGDRLTDGEREELLDWVNQSEDNRAYFLREKELWLSAQAAGETDRFDADAAYSRFCRSVEAETAAYCGEPEPDTHRTPRLMRRLAAIAACIAAAVVLSVSGFYVGRERLKGEMADITVTAPEGSNTEITLPDGTHVWLNSGTRLSYSQRYGLDERHVKIQGEGYFEVKRNRKLPFVVNSHDMSVRVLGTKFNFNDYPSDAKATVTLTEGKVAMRGNLANGQEYILTPDQRAVLDKATGRVVVESCTAADAILWKSGTIAFEGQTLYQIAAQLSKAYNMNVCVKTMHAGQKRFYGEFSRQGQTARDIIDDLCKTSDIRYTVRGRTIEIR